MPNEIGSELWTMTGSAKSSDTEIDMERHIRTAMDKIVALGMADEYDVSVSFTGTETNINLDLYSADQSPVFSGSFQGVF